LVYWIFALKHNWGNKCTVSNFSSMSQHFGLDDGGNDNVTALDGGGSVVSD
jgi:hypothetical protein